MARIIFTVYTTDGAVWESPVQELDELAMAKAMRDWNPVLKDLGNLKHLEFPTIDALGRQTKVYFNPKYIIAVRLTEVTL